MNRLVALAVLALALGAAACSDSASLSGPDELRSGQTFLQDGTDPSSNNGQGGGGNP